MSEHVPHGSRRNSLAGWIQGDADAESTGLHRHGVHLEAAGGEQDALSRVHFVDACPVSVGVGADRDGVSVHGSPAHRSPYCVGVLPHRKADRISEDELPVLFRELEVDGSRHHLPVLVADYDVGEKGRIPRSLAQPHPEHHLLDGNGCALALDFEAAERLVGNVRADILRADGRTLGDRDIGRRPSHSCLDRRGEAERRTETEVNEEQKQDRKRAHGMRLLGQ